jgi:hypothetical protein
MNTKKKPGMFGLLLVIGSLMGLMPSDVFGKASVNPSGSLAFSSVGDYNRRHAC